jgi:hypothetical protein
MHELDLKRGLVPSRPPVSLTALSPKLDVRKGTYAQHAAHPKPIDGAEAPQRILCKSIDEGTEGPVKHRLGGSADLGVHPNEVYERLEHVGSNFCRASRQIRVWNES